MRGRFVTAAMVVVLIGVGFLLGSFWLDWRGTELEAGADRSVEGPATSLPEGWGDRVRVEVLNGMGERGVASTVAERLRDMGFDVVYYGNASTFDHARTSVLLRSDRREDVLRLADSLGVDSLVDRPDPDLYLDGTVIVGEDWERRMAARDTLGPPEPPGFFERLLGAITF